MNLSFFDLTRDIRSKPDAFKIARNALRVLMMGWWDEASWVGLKSWRVFLAVFIKRDPELLRGMRQAFQEGFLHLYSELRESTLTDAQQKQADFFISNCLALLPFADISQHRTFQIPQRIADRWQLVNYRVVPIELTPTFGFEKTFLYDRDRVFAYGLEPIDAPEAEPHLIFMGTTYPAGQGFMTQICADLALETPGESLYRTGRDRITSWLDAQGKPTHVCGMSLGGSLSLLLAMDQGEKLSRVDVLNPPGLYEPWLHRNVFDGWDNCRQKPPVFIQKQARDPVSYFGVWKDDWTLLHVTPPANKLGPNAITDHALNYAGFAETKFFTVNTGEDNATRRGRNFWLYTLGRGFIYYLLLLPFRYVLLPALRFTWDNKRAIALVVATAALVCFIPALWSFILSAILVITAAAYLLYKTIALVQILLGTTPVNNSRCHDSALFEGENDPDELAIPMALP